jgi:RsiW-degrading membrane proteinase PrsW (M82 family)
VNPLDIATLAAAMGLSTVFLVVVVAAVWWFDRYDREPLHLVGGVFLWGALAAPVLSVLLCSATGLCLDLTPGHLAGWFGPLIEESAKAIGLILIVMLSKEFDNPTDGVVYGTAVGLGFAATENLIYTVAGAAGSAIGGTVMLVLIRTAITAGIHAVSSATLGGCLGFAYLSRRRWSRATWAILGLVSATLIHSGWNLALLRMRDSIDPVSPSRWFSAVLVLYLLYLLALFVFLRSEQKILGRELAEEVELEVFPAWIVDVIPYYRRRIRSDWWPSLRERTVLARLLTRLAFRKHAVKNLPDEESDLAGLEVVQLRQRIRAMMIRENPDIPD